MAQIGSFTLNDGKYTGTIRTMTINVKASLIPVKDKRSSDAPDYRVFAGGAELGAAWREQSKDGSDYLAVRLDDPSFDKPVRAAFFADETAGTGALVWNRSQAS